MLRHRRFLDLCFDISESGVKHQKSINHHNILPEDMRESYTTYQLQQKLEKHFGDAIVIQ
jgi:hypothetical protein